MRAVQSAIFQTTVYWFAVGVLILVGCNKQVSQSSPDGLDGSQANKRLSDQPESTKEEGPRPKAVVKQRSHDFGSMDLGEQRKHTFLVENSGEAPLTLQLVETSCKCTDVDLPANSIAPGESGEVVVHWKTGEEVGSFSHGAVLRTNDPLSRSLRFQVHGVVRALLAAEVEYVAIQNMKSGESAEREFVVYSQVWDSFDPPTVSASLETMECRVTPADTQKLEQLRAKSGYRVRVTVPAGLPVGRFDEHVEIVAQNPERTTDDQRLQVEIIGRVQSPLALFGDGIDSRGILRLDKVARGTHKSKSLLLKVRDKQRIELESVEATPEFLDVRLTPHNDAGPDLGLYTVTVTVPDSAPVCNHHGSLRGLVRLKTSHPIKPTIQFAVDFAVVDLKRESGL